MINFASKTNLLNDTTVYAIIRDDDSNITHETVIGGYEGNKSIARSSAIFKYYVNQISILQNILNSTNDILQEIDELDVCNSMSNEVNEHDELTGLATQLRALTEAIDTLITAKTDSKIMNNL